ncbi:MAG: potassium channel family protein [Thermovirgaceae bacterium]
MKQLRPAWAWLFLLVSVFAVGIIGFYTLTDLSVVDSVYYTIITLATVGYNAPPDLNDAGKLFIAFLVILGIGTAGYAVSQVTRYFLVERLLSALGKRRDTRVDRMEKHWIVCGLGRVGMEVIEHLHRDHIPCMALEVADRKVAAARERGWIVQQGDARDEEALESAGVKRAAGLITTLSDDADNVYVIITGRSLNPDLRVIARATDRKSMGVFYKAGAEKVINPVVAGAAAIAWASVKPAVASFLEIVNISRDLDIAFDSIPVKRNSELIGKTLAESPLRSRYNAMVIAVKKESGEYFYNPGSSHVMEQGDELIVIVDRNRLLDLRKEVAGPNL